MSRHAPAYRFATAEHWTRTLLHRFDAGQNGQLTPIARLASRAALADRRAPVSVVAIDPHGSVYWRVDANAASGGSASLLRRDDLSATVGPFEIGGALARGPRWVADGEWIWSFEQGATSVDRYERESLQHALSIAVEWTVLDIAPDGNHGLWALLDAPDHERHLLHIDCNGCPRERRPVPCAKAAPVQLGSIGRGTRAQLVLLARDGKWLIFVNAGTGALDRVLEIGSLGCCWSARQMATDPRGRIALRGVQDPPGSKWMLVVLDGAGDTIDGPVAVSPVEAATRIAVERDAVWFGTNTGLWRLGAAEARDGRESESTIVTPALLSPDSSPERGWLRAEVSIDLPRGAVLEAQFATTDKQGIADQAAAIAADRTQTAQQKQSAIWTLLNPSPAQAVRFASASKPDLPLAIPLTALRDQWLWLRLRVTTPPGTALPRLYELRVLYPDLSIARYLPAIFRSERGDRTLRALIGVIESTTQGLDARIRAIGSYLDPETAPVEWLDYLARWIDLPWDDELPEGAKRRVLAQAGALLDRRGTRDGVVSLVRALAGSAAKVRVSDVTVDYAVSTVGGRERRGTALPVLLAGGSTRTATLGRKAVLGRMCLSTKEDPLGLLRPTLTIDIGAPQDVRRPLEALLERILLQYIPAGVAMRIRWRLDLDPAGSNDGTIVLDEDGPRRLGGDSMLGRTTLAGRRGRLDDAGVGVDVTLR